MHEQIRDNKIVAVESNDNFVDDKHYRELPSVISFYLFQ